MLLAFSQILLHMHQADVGLHLEEDDCVVCLVAQGNDTAAPAAPAVPAQPQALDIAFLPHFAPRCNFSGRPASRGPPDFALHT
jgi:hypothetical protein